jgi:two-component system, NarL family, nitrate/nitrite response regulator NarL
MSMKAASWIKMQRIRLLLLDDHVLFREGLSRLLDSEDDFELVAQCGTPSEGLDVIARSPIDVVLLDYDLENDTGTRFISAAHASGFRGKILMVTAGMNELQSALAWKLGIAGISLKHSSPPRLLQAIRTVSQGGTWSDQKVIVEGASNPETRTSSDLTPREQRVLRGVLEGLTNKEIAHGVGASLSSVKAILQQLFDKTGVRTRSQLVRVAIERSLETVSLRPS